MLVFLAPEDRIVNLRSQLRRRALEAGKTLSDVDAERKCVRVDGSQRHLLLVNWTGLRERMSARTRDEEDADADIRQLRGLADFAEEGQFRPIRDTPEAPHMRDMQRTIDAATERGITDGWASRMGSNRTPRSYGYGRYLKLGGRVVWFGIHTGRCGRWDQDGEKPLWLDCGNGRWVPIPTLMDNDVEYADVLNGVVSALRDFAEAPEDRR